MSKFKLSFVLSILLMFKVSNASALVINEVSTYASEDWIELYSDSDEDVFGYTLKDSSATNEKKIEESKIIGPSSGSSYFVIEFSRYLNKEEDTVYLYNKEGEMIDQVTYGTKDTICAPNDDQSIGRKPNGKGPFQRLATPTQGMANSNEEAPCPTPVPTKTPTPTPINTKTPEATITPRPTLLSSPSPKVLAVTAKPTSKSTTENENDTEDENKGWSTPGSSNTDPPDAEVMSDTDRRLSPNIIASFFMLAGGFFVGFPAVRYYNSKKEAKDV